MIGMILSSAIGAVFIVLIWLFYTPSKTEGIRSRAFGGFFCGIILGIFIANIILGVLGVVK